jgi:hypothetical protein
VASELVGNATAHARTACRLDVRLDALGLTIAVRDYDYRGLLINPLACNSAGRRDHGLFLVASISRAWGVSPTENGKSVWALLPVTAGVVLGQPARRNPVEQSIITSASTAPGEAPGSAAR